MDVLKMATERTLVLRMKKRQLKFLGQGCLKENGITKITLSKSRKDGWNSLEIPENDNRKNSCTENQKKTTKMLWIWMFRKWQQKEFLYWKSRKDSWNSVDKNVLKMAAERTLMLRIKKDNWNSLTKDVVKNGHRKNTYSQNQEIRAEIPWIRMFWKW